MYQVSVNTLTFFIEAALLLGLDSDLFRCLFKQPKLEVLLQEAKFVELFFKVHLLATGSQMQNQNQYFTFLKGTFNNNDIFKKCIK